MDSFSQFHNLLAEKVKSAGGVGSNSDEEFLTPEQRVQDKWVKERIGQTLKDFESEMQANQARGKKLLHLPISGLFCSKLNLEDDMSVICI